MLISPPMLLVPSVSFTKPYYNNMIMNMKYEFPSNFEEIHHHHHHQFFSKFGHQDHFHHFEQIQANGSSINFEEIQYPCDFETLNPNIPYGYPNSSSNNNNIEDYYEMKPQIADHHHHLLLQHQHQNGGNDHGLVMDNFQSGGLLTNHPQRSFVNGGVGGSNSSIITQQMIKSINFVIPDEISCIDEGYISYRKLDNNNNGSILSSSFLRRSSYKAATAQKKTNLIKGQWTAEDDRLLVRLVEQHGVRKWSHIAQMLPGRIGKQCRERWHNHLRPDIKKDTWSEEEDKVLIQSHAEIGNKWAEIAKKLPGRTENSIKNHWNATKRRQYSKRKCRLKYPRTSLLGDYIKSLNLDLYKTRYQRKNSTNSSSTATTATTSVANNNNNHMKRPEICPDQVRWVPNFDFNDNPDDFVFDDNYMFQDGNYGIDSLIDDIPCAP